MSKEYFPEFANALKTSEAGQSLLTTYRWESHFRTDEDNETWRRVFGATGQVFTHSVLFYGIGKWFARKEASRFTPDKWQTFLYGVGPHDTGEAKLNGKGVGDVSAQVKTEEDEKAESRMAKRVIKSLNLKDSLKEKLRYGYDQVINGKDPELHFAFKAIEKSEYVITAMKVFQNQRKLEAQGLPGLNPEMELALVGRVLVIDLAKVLDVYAPKFPDSIGELFRCSAPLIDKMLEFSEPWLMTHTEWKGKEINHPALTEAFKAKWEVFKNS